MSECRQQNIVLEGELEQAVQETERKKSSLDTYMQKYQAATEQIGSIQETLNTVEDQLVASRNKVSQDL